MTASEAILQSFYSLFKKIYLGMEIFSAISDDDGPVQSSHLVILGTASIK